MKKQDLLWTPFLMLVYREIRRFSKVLAQTVLIPVLNSIIYLLIFGVSLGQDIQVLQGITYMEFLIPGLIIMGCMNNSYQNSSSSLLSMKFGGEIIDIKVAPLSVQQIVWAISLGGLFRGFVVGIMTFFTGELFHYWYEGTWLSVTHPFYVIFFCSVGGLAFSKLGIWVAFFSKSFDHVSAIGGFIIMPLIALGGVFFSLDKLSPFWQTVSHFNPLFYFINGVRYGILNVSDVPIMSSVLMALLSLFLFHILAVWTLSTGKYQRW